MSLIRTQEDVDRDLELCKIKNYIIKENPDSRIVTELIVWLAYWNDRIIKDLIKK